MEGVMDERVQVRVSGHVQGVGFRYYAVHVARDLGIRGIVRNTSDGGVEAVAEGPRPILDQFVDAFRRGPHSAEVADAATAWSAATGDFQDFAVVP
jgi:acylphosphatase